MVHWVWLLFAFSAGALLVQLAWSRVIRSTVKALREASAQLQESNEQWGELNKKYLSLTGGTLQ